MAEIYSHIPFLKTINDFFRLYGLKKPLHPEIMCMRLQDQPDDKLMHMPLYRANFFRVILFTNAHLHFASGDKKHSVINNCLCFTYPGKLESWKRSGRLYGYVIYFTPSFAGLDITNKHFDKDYPYFNFSSELLLPLSSTDAASLKKQAGEMVKEMYSNESDRLEMIRKLLLLYLHNIKRIYNKTTDNLPAEVKVSKTIYNRFRKELDDYLQQQCAGKENKMPTVSLFAGRLAVNANYLNSIIKKLTGKTASAHIQEKIILEAKSFLIHTDLQVAEICFKLGFENTSYFNRFFKKQTGITPIQFRKQFPLV